MTTRTADIYPETAFPTCAFRMIRIEGGTFWMGSEEEEAYSDEKPEHEVVVSSYYLGEYPVTQALWEAVMEGENPSYFRGGRRPVEQVSWEDIERFLDRLNERTEKTYRLPTEAEWEYAARGGKWGKGYPYAGSPKLKEVAWFEENSHMETKPVGMKQPNELGLYDMSGNVWEWVGDWFSDNYYEECSKKGLIRDPEGPETGAERVIRGGSWSDHRRYCRVSYRNAWLPGNRYSDVGFRLAFSPQF